MTNLSPDTLMMFYDVLFLKSPCIQRCHGKGCYGNHGERLLWVSGVQCSQLLLLVLELFPRQAIASHPHNKHCITHPQERNVHHMYQEEGPVGYINFQCTHLGHCPTPRHTTWIMTVLVVTLNLKTKVEGMLDIKLMSVRPQTVPLNWPVPSPWSFSSHLHEH